MSYRRWFFITLGFIVLAAFAVCASSYAVDIFGVFRDSHGRALRVYNNERVGKYLLNQRYVPQNFDALLIGSSLSANWRADLVQGGRVYNESMDGANAAEEKLLVDQALPHGHFRFAICLLSPAMTSDHSLKEAGMGSPSRMEALGSISILREEGREALDRLRPRPPQFFADGGKVLQESKRSGGWVGPMWGIDPEGVKVYGSLLDELRSHGIRIIFVAPPIGEPTFSTRRNQLEEYETQTGLVRPGEALIDFNRPEFQSFRANTENYYDDVHLTPEAAHELSLSLNGALQAILKQPTQ